MVPVGVVLLRMRYLMVMVIVITVMPVMRRNTMVGRSVVLILVMILVVLSCVNISMPRPVVVPGMVVSVGMVRLVMVNVRVLGVMVLPVVLVGVIRVVRGVVGISVAISVRRGIMCNQMLDAVMH